VRLADGLNLDFAKAVGMAKNSLVRPQHRRRGIVYYPLDMSLLTELGGIVGRYSTKMPPHPGLAIRTSNKTHPFKLPCIAGLLRRSPGVRRDRSFNRRLAAAMPLSGERTRLACRLRRLGEDFQSLTFWPPNGGKKLEQGMGLASRQTRQASGLRSPLRKHRYCSGRPSQNAMARQNSCRMIVRLGVKRKPEVATRPRPIPEFIHRPDA